MLEWTRQKKYTEGISNSPFLLCDEGQKITRLAFHLSLNSPTLGPSVFSTQMLTGNEMPKCISKCIHRGSGARTFVRRDDACLGWPSLTRSLLGFVYPVCIYARHSTKAELSQAPMARGVDSTSAAALLWIVYEICMTRINLGHQQK